MKETKREQVAGTASVISNQQTEQNQQSVNRALDETKSNIRRATDEARKEIPRYTQAVNEYQEQTIQATREIADNYLESQKEIINSLQSSWVPFIENAYGMYHTIASPRRAANLYASFVSSFADNTIAATKVANNTLFANIETFKTSMQHAKDNLKELSRISIQNATKSFDQTTRQSIKDSHTETEIRRW